VDDVAGEVGRKVELSQCAPRMSASLIAEHSFEHEVALAGDDRFSYQHNLTQVTRD
jgi:hypothetical protein